MNNIFRLHTLCTLQTSMQFNLSIPLVLIKLGHFSKKAPGTCRIPPEQVFSFWGVELRRERGEATWQLGPNKQQWEICIHARLSGSMDHFHFMLKKMIVLIINRGAWSTMHTFMRSTEEQLIPITEMNRKLLFLNLNFSNADCITATKTFSHTAPQAISICFYLLVSRKYVSL